MTNTDKRGRVSGSAPAAGSDEVLPDESLFMFAEQRGRKVLGVKSEFEKWCESFSIRQVLKRFGIDGKPGDRVVLKNFYLGEQTIRIAEDDRHFFNIYGVGYDDEFESDFPQDAYSLVNFFGLGYRYKCGWEREVLNDL